MEKRQLSFQRQYRCFSEFPADLGRNLQFPLYRGTKVIGGGYQGDCLGVTGQLHRRFHSATDSLIVKAQRPHQFEVQGISTIE